MPRINNPKPPKRAPKIDSRRGPRRSRARSASTASTRSTTRTWPSCASTSRTAARSAAARVSGNCQQHQRDVTDAIKTARELALLPYTQRTVTERRGGRGGRDDAARVGRVQIATKRETPAEGAEADPGRGCSSSSRTLGVAAEVLETVPARRSANEGPAAQRRHAALDAAATSST